jgi:Holliday junction resolvase-like predicted endonuclease
LRPAAAVNREKQRLLINAARSYLRCHPTAKQPRFDVVEVYASKKEKRAWWCFSKFKADKITVIESAFGLS